MICHDCGERLGPVENENMETWDYNAIGFKVEYTERYYKVTEYICKRCASKRPEIYTMFMR